jgi:pyruvate ferredoxin oxidoreductase gamma subunit
MAQDAAPATVPSMLQVRFHGRGGQGVVTAAELLSVAAFNDGRHAQAFPSFGSERTGAPVMAFCRIGDGPIRTREPVVRPDALVIQDPTLLHLPEVFAGFEDGCVLVNSSRAVDLERGRVVVVPATELARTHLGRPLPGAPLLGALAAATGAVSLQAIAAAFRERFPGPVGEGNVAAAEAAHALVAGSRIQAVGR